MADQLRLFEPPLGARFLRFRCVLDGCHAVVHSGDVCACHSTPPTVASLAWGWASR